MSNNKKQPRHNARRYAIQGLYQWSFTETEPQELVRQLSEEADHDAADMVYFKELLTGTIQHIVMIDELMVAHLDRSIKSLNPVELSILRVAIYELLHRIEVPNKVIINEALELAKEFGATDGHKYVNAVLDKLATDIRSVERG